jgi:hypothetical protein
MNGCGVISHDMNIYEFSFGESQLRFALTLPPNLRQQFVNAPRSYTYSGVLPRDWKKSYFQMFLQHPADTPPVRGLLEALRQAGKPKDTEALMRLAVAFVQSAIGYDREKADQIATGKMRYPSETLLDGHGVCADKTILLAAILQQLGFGLTIFTWERANHMALGLRVPQGYGNFGTAYAMVETTGPNAIGQVPERYVGGTKLDARPEVVELGGAGVYQGIVAQRKEEAALERQYGKDYLAMPPAQQALFRRMQPLQAEIAALAQQMKGCSGTLPPARYAECQSLHQRHKAKVEEYNALVVRFNAAP